MGASKGCLLVLLVAVLFTALVTMTFIILLALGIIKLYSSPTGIGNNQTTTISDYYMNNSTITTTTATPNDSPGGPGDGQNVLDSPLIIPEFPLERLNRHCPIPVVLPSKTPDQQQCSSYPVNLNAPERLVPTEKNIGVFPDNVTSVRPILYDLMIEFTSKRTYAGTLTLTLLAVGKGDTRYLIIHLDSENVKGWNNQFRLFHRCTGKVICIKQLLIINKDTFRFELSEPYLAEGEYYDFHVDRFTGAMDTSLGLYAGDQMDPSYATGTIFQMRYARTVFPCMDHPALKAQFKLRVRHGLDYLARSCMVETESPTKISSSALETSFPPTPPIPTYIFTFSVIRKMNSTVVTKGNTTIELILPLEQASGGDYDGDNNNNNNGNSQHEWMITESAQVIQLMENYTKVPFQLERLAFLNTLPAPFWGIENFGLVTLDWAWTKTYEADVAHTILVHEVIHQWLGNIFTIRYWDEICLQEGLTAYLTSYIAEHLGLLRESFSAKMESNRRSSLQPKLNDAPLRTYARTQDIANRCFERPPLIFSMLADLYGSDKVQHGVLGFLTRKYIYSNAGLPQWIEAINLVTKDPNSGNILKTYFTQPGYPMISAYRENGTLHVSQQAHTNEVTPKNPDALFTLPIHYLSSTGHASSYHIFANKTMSVDITESNHNNSLTPVSSSDNDEMDWFVLDPKGRILALNLYHASNYKAILDCFKLQLDVSQEPKKECPLSNHQIHQVMQDFCYGLQKNKFPLESESNGGDKNDQKERWNDVFTVLRELTDRSKRGQSRIRMPSSCSCCFKTEEDLRSERRYQRNSCKGYWSYTCSKLTLVTSVLGRNYADFPN